MPNILEQILHRKKIEIKGLVKKYQSVDTKPTSRDFLVFLKKKKHEPPKLIAEIKKISPSFGEIWPEADVLKIADIYGKNGATAISCLTDEFFFGGHLQDLRRISEQVKIPVLRKDFILETSQIREARIFGADAVLLMVSVLKNADKINELLEYAKKFNMKCLVETHNAEEIKIAVTAGAEIIGVNSRNFSDLSINFENFKTLLPLIPDSIVKVAESGIENKEIIKKIAPFCDAILVGTFFMKTRDYGKLADFVRKFTQK